LSLDFPDRLSSLSIVHSFHITYFRLCRHACLSRHGVYQIASVSSLVLPPTFPAKGSQTSALVISFFVINILCAFRYRVIRPATTKSICTIYVKFNKNYCETTDTVRLAQQLLSRRSGISRKLCKSQLSVRSTCGQLCVYKQGSPI
jgi:hypothetical protein